jgi:hypothetical protein
VVTTQPLRIVRAPVRIMIAKHLVNRIPRNSRHIDYTKCRVPNDTKQLLEVLPGFLCSLISIPVT